MNDKNNKKSDQLKKTLTVEDLAQVIGGATDIEEGTLKSGGETKYPQREGRYPPVIEASLITVAHE